MRNNRSWFERPRAALCALLGLTIFSVYLILGSGNRRENGGGTAFRITLRHYGLDVREMESDVAIPLEDALSAISGISRIATVSENGQVRAYVDFRQKRRGFRLEENDHYESVREAAQRVYETLPSSAQRPEINASEDSRVPFWTAAVYSSGNETVPPGALLERTIKPALSAIEGVGEVEIAGPGIRELVISVNQEKSAALGLSPSDIARTLAENDALFSGGFLRLGELDIPVSVDGRYAQLKDLEEALIPLDSGGTVMLKTVAAVREQEREAETFSRLNGKRTALVSVTAALGADPGVLSRRIKKEIKKFSFLPLEFRVLEDRGAEEASGLRSVFAAALGSSLLVALAAFFLKGGNFSGGAAGTGVHDGLISAAAIPLVSIISAAVLSFAGFPVNRRFLAGLAAGIGGAADAVILSAEGFGRAENPGEGKMILRGIWSPLVSGAATTAATLLPLAGIGGGDITVIAAAIGTVTLVSTILALALLPPLFLRKKTVFPKFREFSRSPGTGLLMPPVLGLLKNCRRRLFRGFTFLVRLSESRPFIFPVIALLISAAAFTALILSGADTTGEWAENSVYVRFEFEGGFLKQEGDLLLAAWALEIKKHPAVREVQTGARTGSGYGLVTFDPRKAETAEIRKRIRLEPVPGAFVYIPEMSPDDRIWSITVSGDDAEKCRELAANAASLCSAIAPVKETVLNFKEGGPRLTLIPRREILARGGMSFSFPADTVRRGVHGPVAYKRTGGGETDVRVRFGPSEIFPPDYEIALNGNDVLLIPLASYGDGLAGTRTGSLMEAVRTTEVSSIQRENRRRSASFSIRTKPGDPRFFRDKIMTALENLKLPPGYRIEFDPEAIREAEALSGRIFNFFWAVLFCYMIIAAAEESFILPLVILASVFPSLALPVFALSLSGVTVNTATACALVAVSGMTVNASVISAGELWRRVPGKNGSVYRVLRSRLPALTATAGTTIAGSLPFLFLTEGSNALVKTLAFVTALGVGTSFFCSLTLVPSLMNLIFRNRIGRPRVNQIFRFRTSPIKGAE